MQDSNSPDESALLAAPPWRLEQVFISISARLRKIDLMLFLGGAELPQQAASAWQNEPPARLGSYLLLSSSN